jgi:hypothetical protein
MAQSRNNYNSPVARCLDYGPAFEFATHMFLDLLPIFVLLFARCPLITCFDLTLSARLPIEL